MPSAATSIEGINIGNFIDQMLCYYTNFTNQIQIIRIINMPDLFLERVIFPGQRLLFDASPAAQVEVYTAKAMGAVLSDQISCQSLRVNEMDFRIQTSS